MATPLRILCLHGYTQVAIGEKVYITAPHVVPIPTPSSIEEREQQQQEDDDVNREPESFGWWTRGPNNAYVGFDESLSLIAKTLDDQGPFDGILGFSQGAAMASIVQLLLERPQLDPIMSQCRHGPLKFSILVSGFLPTDPAKFEWFTSKYSRSENRLAVAEAPDKEQTNAAEQLTTDSKDCRGVAGASLHVIGRGDVIIEPERSEALVHEYTQRAPTVLYHDGGHFVPSNAASRNTYRAFVEPYVQAKLVKMEKASS
ncbi:hypothetical protein BGW42_008529 [Actinomortierella wolfii]|nr:hypothetical protein BGW42_008529 [Actinomortierella wolfii]